ncbi:MAG: hypothetical protein ABDH59_06250 [Fervidobacterium sp.]
MKRRTPIGSRKWKGVTDFDLKILSILIIILSLSTITLVIYAFYLKYQKSQVNVVIREITPQENVVTQKITKSATETLVIMQQINQELPEQSSETPTKISKTSTQTEQGNVAISQEKLTQTPKVLLQPNKEQENASASATTTNLVPSKTEDLKIEESQNKLQIEETEENKYLKELTKFDYNLLVSRMAENLPSSVLNSIYLYTVDGENALKIAKSTQNYVIDQLDTSKYIVLTLSNIAPELNSSKSVYTIMTEPVKESKEAFKSVVNFRTLGISSFSISTSKGYIICLGLFASESKAKNFYYSQDWVELSKYGYVKGAKVSKIGN